MSCRIYYGVIEVTTENPEEVIELIKEHTSLMKINDYQYINLAGIIYNFDVGYKRITIKLEHHNNIPALLETYALTSMLKEKFGEDNVEAKIVADTACYCSCP